MSAKIKVKLTEHHKESIFLKVFTQSLRILNKSRQTTVLTALQCRMTHQTCWYIGFQVAPL